MVALAPPSDGENWAGRVLDEKRKFMDSLFDSVGREKILEDPEFTAYPPSPSPSLSLPVCLSL